MFFSNKNIVSVIARRLIIYMVFFSSFITLLMTSVQLLWDYNRDINLIEEQLEQVNDVHLKTLTNNLWVSDENQIKIHLSGILQLRDMQYLEVKYDENKLITVGKKTTDNIVVETFPMLYLYRGKKINIGTLTVIESLSGVYKRLLDKVWLILGSNAVKTFLVSSFMLILFHQLNTRHLVKIANFTRDINTSGLDHELVLSRSSTESNPDELDYVVDAINEMQLNIKKAFTALVQSEDSFQVLAKVSPVGIFRADNKGDCTYVNESWCEMAGLEVSDALGYGWASAIHPDDLGNVYSEWTKVVSNKTQLKIECRFIHKDGKVIWVFIQSDVVANELNEIVGFVGAITDITERKIIEDVLKVLAIGSAGLQFEKFLTDSLSHLCGLFQCRYVLLSDLSSDGINSTTYVVLDDGELIENFTYQLVGTPCEDVLIRKKNIIITDAATLYPNDQMLIDMNVDSYIGAQLVNSDGVVIGILAVMDDKKLEYEGWMEPVINLFAARMSIELQRELASKDILKQQEHLEELVVVRTTELEGALEYAKKANDAKSDFLSRMSHELRTPMNAILGFAQILQLDFDELKLDHQNNVNEILDAGSHLLELINEVLDLAKIESGKVEVLQEDIPIKDLMKQCLTLIATAAAKKDINIVDNICDKNDVVIGDFIRLKQVILNILSNAVKYNDVSGTIVIDSEVKDGLVLRISVTDSGKGISDDDIGKLFTSFERLDETNNVEGTGIGLVITKNLVQLMNGSIGVSSEVNKGTTFWIEFSLSNSLTKRTSK